MWIRILIREQVRERRGESKKILRKKKKLKFRRLRFERVSEAHSYIRLYASRNSRLWHRHAHRYRNFYVRTFSCNNKVYLLPRRNNTIIQTVFPKFGKAYRIFFGWLDIKWLEDTRERKKREREREREEGGRIRPWNRERYQFLISWNISLQCEFHVTWNKSEIWKICRYE